MTYDEFREAIKTKFMYEAIYDDSEGREILVIRTLDAYSMMRRIKPWVELTEKEFSDCLVEGDPCEALAEPEAWAVMREVAAKSKEKNT